LVSAADLASLAGFRAHFNIVTYLLLTYIVGALELRSLGMGGVADLKIHAAPRHVLPRQIW